MTPEYAKKIVRKLCPEARYIGNRIISPDIGEVGFSIHWDEDSSWIKAATFLKDQNEKWLWLREKNEKGEIEWPKAEGEPINLNDLN